MHLTDNNPFGSVDDEGTIGGHERNVAHVHILLFDVLDRARPGFFVNIKYDQTQCHL